MGDTVLSLNKEGGDQKRKRVTERQNLIVGQLDFCYYVQYISVYVFIDWRGVGARK